MSDDKYKDVEWMTIGDGPVRIQVAKIKGLNMGTMFYLSQKLSEITQDGNLKLKESK